MHALQICMSAAQGPTVCGWLLDCLRLSAASAAALAAVDALALAGTGAFTRGAGAFLAGCAGGAKLPEPIPRKLRTALAKGCCCCCAAAATKDPGVSEKP